VTITSIDTQDIYTVFQPAKIDQYFYYKFKLVFFWHWEVRTRIEEEITYVSSVRDGYISPSNFDITVLKNCKIA